MFPKKFLLYFVITWIDLRFLKAFKRINLDYIGPNNMYLRFSSFRDLTGFVKIFLKDHTIENIFILFAVKIFRLRYIQHYVN